ncbi:MAG: hypothetical protein ACTSPQ_12580 [Candidatus Helarchaeota archaeon]
MRETNNNAISKNMIDFFPFIGSANSLRLLKNQLNCGYEFTPIKIRTTDVMNEINDKTNKIL